MSSDIDERTLREVHLYPFEQAVKRAKTWGIMSSYNKVNGTYAAENHWALTNLLRGDWGFDGVVMSDWFGSRSTELTVNGGLDLEMPGPTRDRGDKLVAAVREMRVAAETVRERSGNMLRLMVRTGAIHDRRVWQERADDRLEHRALIRRAGAEGTVLLKNDGLLPLGREGTIAVIGPNAKVAQIMGGRSAQLNPHYRVSPWDGLVAAGASPGYGGGLADRRAGGNAVAGAGTRGDAGVVSGAGGGRCDCRCAVRVGRTRRAAGADVPPALGRQPDLEPGPRGLSGAERP